MYDKVDQNTEMNGRICSNHSCEDPVLQAVIRLIPPLVTSSSSDKDGLMTEKRGR